MYIFAMGKFGGEDLTVEVKDDVFLFNGRKDTVLMKVLEAHLKERHLFAGTYFPPADYDGINIYNVLENHFFDAQPKIKAKNVPKMDNVRGRIY